MKKIAYLSFAAALGLTSCQQQKVENKDLAAKEVTDAKPVYTYKVEALDGGTIDLSQYKGKKILIVNTASKCGFTPQYKELEELSKKYANSLVVIGFPANNFGGQEPGTNQEIKSFCEKNYGVTFPMAAKVSVKGEDMHPLFHYLTEKSLNGKKDTDIKWNFTKFLLDENGYLIDSFGSRTTPLSDEITSKL